MVIFQLIPHEEDDCRQGKSAPKTVRKPFRKNDANKLSVCSIKGTCPIADVYNCQFTYGGYDPLTMSAIGLYGSVHLGRQQHLRPNPVRRWKPALLLRSAHCSNVPGVTGLYKSWKVSGSKVSLSSVLQSSNTVPVYVWLLPVSSRQCVSPNQSPQPRRVSSLKAHHPHSGGGSPDRAEDNKLSSYLRPTTTSPGTTGMSTLQYQGAYSSGPQKLTYWYIIAKPADECFTTSQIFIVTGSPTTASSLKRAQIALSP